jgi:hypothetical protein
MAETEQKDQSEREKLEKEKIALAKKLGIWDKDEPVENFRETPEFTRIQEINAKLTFLVKD